MPTATRGPQMEIPGYSPLQVELYEPITDLTDRRITADILEL